MSFQNKIEQYLKEIQELERIFSEAQGKEILPLSFFSSSIDVINRLKTGVYEIEAAQLLMMKEHLKKGEIDRTEVREVNVLGDATGRKVIADFGKSLSLNDRFMFQRDLFQENADEMNETFTQLNAFQSLNEALKFLNEKYAITWNCDAGAAFKELLDKRFT
jgi:hypothetical protein